MATSHTRFFVDATRIPLYRFATHLLLSTLAISVPRLLQRWDLTVLTAFIAVQLGAIAQLVAKFRNPGPQSPSPSYCTCVSMYLALLFQGTTIIGKHIADDTIGFSQNQHIVVNFCLTFFISEIEFYRAYTNFKDF